MNILRITSSPKGKVSESRKLGAATVEKLLAANPCATVLHKDLTAPLFPQLEEAFLNALFTPAEQHLENHKAALIHSDEAIAEINNADVLVIESPFYNFSITSTLKAWIDHIVRPGITFKYTENGPVGLINGKKVFILITSGGVYSHGPAQAMDFAAPYLKTILGFLGMTDVTVIHEEGLKIDELKDNAFEKALAEVLV